MHRLEPTPSTLCEWCGCVVPGTRAGYSGLCPRCAALPDPAADAAAEAAERDRYPYRSPRQALARSYYTMDRLRGVKARWPDHVTLGPDRGEYLPRVDGGQGSQRPVKAAEAALVDGHVLAVCSEAERDVVAAWACGLIERDGGGWAWAGEQLGCPEERAPATLGEIVRRVYARLRGAGLCPPRVREAEEAGTSPDGGEAVTDYLSGWAEIAAALDVSEKTAARLARDSDLPVFRIGARVLLRRAALTAWLMAREAEAGKGKVAA